MIEKCNSPAKTTAFILLLALLFSCSKNTGHNPSPVEYSFFFAGHTYGTPGIGSSGLYVPFRAKFDWIKSQEKMAFGVLTGDIVLSSNAANWDKIDADIAALGLPVYFAAGNHDLTDRNLFENRYGKTYFSFEKGNDLFIIFDPNIDHWNISGEQLTFFINKIAEKNWRNIFIFSHQLIWWEPGNMFNKTTPNSTAGKTGPTNFWTDIEPRLSSLKCPVLLVSGDVGAFPNGSEILFHQNKNLTYIASGMGGGKRDNFVVAHIHENGTTDFELIALNETNSNAMGKLEDYMLQ